MNNNYKCEIATSKQKKSMELVHNSTWSIAAVKISRKQANFTKQMLGAGTLILLQFEVNS